MDNRESIDPIIGTLTCERPRDSREIFRGDVQLVCIIVERAVFYILSIFKHADEIRHHLNESCRYLFVGTSVEVDAAKVEYQILHGMIQCLAAEDLVSMNHSPFYIPKVVQDKRLLFLVQGDDGFQEDFR